ncbi:hypothetical protein HGRIS_010912 [Hohenbuehelia grisea]|uniref:Uncharacterized protein n=1 Tax=Hohenbuehelia grisea TaxID=104357 RepID=A0ABR3IYH1_9AGAR
MWHTDGIPLYKSIHREVSEIVKTVEYRKTAGFNRTAKGQSDPNTRASKRNNDSQGDDSRASKRSKGKDVSADQSREEQGSRASRGSKRGGSRGASAGTSTIVTRSQRKK